MPLIDIIIVCIVGGFALFGFLFGFFHTLGSLLGTIVGTYLGARYYEPMAGWLSHITGWEGNTTRVIMFTLAFFIINRLVGFVFYFIDKILHVATHLPFVKSINRLLGLILGLAEGAISVGLVLFFIERFPISQALIEKISLSHIAPYLSGLAGKLWPLLPQAMQFVQTSVEYVETVIK